MSISPIDGRYANITAPLQSHFSEFAYLRARVAFEIDYLIALSNELQIARLLTDTEMRFLVNLQENFSLTDAQQVKEFERSTRHDVKAIEYYLRAQLSTTSLSDVVEWLHFGLTSADINCTVQAIALRDSRNSVILPVLDKILKQLADLVIHYKSTPMLARTHGQPAVPTTFGKEMAVFLGRLMNQRKALAAHKFEAKITGAVGSFNAQAVAYPGVNWLTFSKSFLEKYDLISNTTTTQILPFDNWLTYFHTTHLTNSILLDLAQDMWRYISDGYLKLRVVEHEVGSSTMPQKVNPIDFENAEGNIGIANALFDHYMRKLPVSRLQRDLSDSTVRRTFGSAMGHSLVGYSSISKGLDRIAANRASMRADLESHWEVVAEGAQTILRTANVASGYHQIQNFSRGKEVTQKLYFQWIEQLDIDESIQVKLKQLTPLNYIGISEKIAENVYREFVQHF